MIVKITEYNRVGRGRRLIQALDAVNNLNNSSRHYTCVSARARVCMYVCVYKRTYVRARVRVGFFLSRSFCQLASRYTVYIQ